MLVEDLRKRCESPFERDLYDELTQRGYWVTPQVKAGQYRIDFVVEGNDDARLAVECDGDKYHGPDKWADDMQRQRDSNEQAGCFGVALRQRSSDSGQSYSTICNERFKPEASIRIGAENAPRSIHVELRRYSANARFAGV